MAMRLRRQPTSAGARVSGVDGRGGGRALGLRAIQPRETLANPVPGETSDASGGAKLTSECAGVAGNRNGHCPQGGGVRDAL